MKKSSDARIYILAWIVSATQIMGSRLDFGDEANEGVYFVSVADEKNTVKASVIHYRTGFCDRISYVRINVHKTAWKWIPSPYS